jgi:hypothetical protein
MREQGVLHFTEEMRVFIAVSLQKRNLAQGRLRAHHDWQQVADGYHETIDLPYGRIDELNIVIEDEPPDIVMDGMAVV